MNQSKFDVVVVGSIGVDTNVYLHEQEVDLTAEANFTLILDSVGGAGGYASRGYAQLGKRTAIIAHVARCRQILKAVDWRTSISGTGLVTCCR